MTFSEKVKRETVKNEYPKSCCQLAHLYGQLCFTKEFSKYRTTFTSEHEFLIRHFIKTLKNNGIDTTKVAVSHNSKTFTASISDRATNDRLLFDFGYVGDEANLRLIADNLICGDCFGAFVSGAFLAGGTVTDPGVNYHLEFSTHKSAFCTDFFELLNSNGFGAKMSERGYSKIIYFKDSGKIEDILALIGATDCSMQLMDTKIYKDVRNKANRITNCETANIDKTLAASEAIAADIRLLISSGAFEELPNDVKQVAITRLENPELSLVDIGQMLKPVLAKSAVNYRLIKIKQLAGELKEK